jgi:hypothetical protein
MSNAMLRDLAIKCGHSTFLGTPCKACDSKLRSASERYRCVECHRKHSKKYNRANSVERNIKSLEWANANTEYRKNVRESKR